MIIQNICNYKSFNLGDRSSSPFSYFTCSSPVNIFNIHKLETNIPQKECKSISKIDFENPIIFGGGGLLYYRNEIFNWYKLFKYSILNSRSKIICWGIGLNDYCSSDLPNFLKNISLVGMRSLENNYFFVPCPSCLNIEFDIIEQPKTDFVVYEHYENNIKEHLDFPRKKNNGNFAETIKFLSSGETVITNTYHGLYWATLLKRKVILMDSDGSSRFAKFPFPFLCASRKSEIFKLSKKSNIYEDSLLLCRSLNIDFSKKVSELLEVDFRLKKNPSVMQIKI